MNSLSPAARRRIAGAETVALRTSLSRYTGDQGLSGEVARKAVADIDRRVASVSRWDFKMFNLELFEEVTEYVRSECPSGVLATRAWLKCIKHMDRKSGFLKVGRAELAEELGITPGQVSRILAALCRCGALRRERFCPEGFRGVAARGYVVNELIATGLTGRARDRAQDAAPKLNFAPVKARPTERRALRPELSVVPL